jgi:arylsulfatase A-like enzyme
MTDTNPGESAAPVRPNVILIMVDDMGFSDIGCYGSEIRTPNINRLAQGGMSFRQMYNCARCCPTRASILTGLYPHQAGIGAMVSDFGHPGYRGFLNDRCVTIAEALKTGGYRTFMSGKWHVGGPYNVRRPETWTPGDATHPTPLQRGFEEHFGTLCGAGSYWFPPTLTEGGEFIRPESDDFYVTDAISDHAAKMIEKGAASEQPFFLYVGYTAPHWPLHARQEDIARYRGRYRKGWDAVRTARHEQLKGFGLVDPKWAISPRDEQAPPWEDIPDQEMQDLRMAVYAAQIDAMDQGIGHILSTLDKLDLTEDTLVLFLSDNGGCHEWIEADTPWAQNLKRQTLHGQEVQVGDVPGLEPGPDTTYQSYSRPWANASNTPFRMFKHWVHEGGIATPLLAYWPSRISPGVQTDHLAHVIDILPTCLDAAGTDYPEQHNGKAIRPAAGQSLLRVLCGGPANVDRSLFWEHEGNRAVRQGRWKLVSRDLGPWELYDMVEDRTELTNLAEKDPARVGNLNGAYDEWAGRNDVLPWKQVRSH